MGEEAAPRTQGPFLYFFVILIPASLLVSAKVGPFHQASSDPGPEQVFRSHAVTAGRLACGPLTLIL